MKKVVVMTVELQLCMYAHAVYSMGNFSMNNSYGYQISGVNICLKKGGEIRGKI
jgi:hypothetical protein